MQIKYLWPVLLIGLATCSSPSLSPPVRQVPVVERPAPAAPSVVQPKGDWLDWPIAPGDWSYRKDANGSIATYGNGGTAYWASLRCDRQAGRVYLAQRHDIAGKLTVRSSSMMRELAMRTSGAQPKVEAELLPTDPLLDAIAFSRGRFALEQVSVQSVAIPSWAEILRVIEDCRA